MQSLNARAGGKPKADNAWKMKQAAPAGGIPLGIIFFIKLVGVMREQEMFQYYLMFKYFIYNCLTTDTLADRYGYY